MAEFVLLEDAASLVSDGVTLGLGGMTLYRRPTAYVRALLARNPRPEALTLLAFTASYASDLLVGSGCVTTVRTCYFGLEEFGLAPMFTTMVGNGKLHIVEETEMSLVMGLRARISGVGFMPSRAWIGTDLPRLRPDVKTVDDPYSGERLMAFPAIPVDVAVLHGLAADRNGDVLLNNNLGVDMELAYAADTVVVTVERLVDRLERTTDGVILPAPGSDYIVEVPEGAKPASCYPVYPLDGDAIIRYVEFCNAGNFDAYLDDLMSTSL